MQETVISHATFDPKVKSYWVLNAVFLCLVTMIGIPLIPIVAIIVWLVSDRMIKAMSAQLLQRKLVVKRGIWFVVEKSIPLEKITDVALSQGPIMRMFGLYRLSFETAGQSGPGALVSLIGVNDASSFREQILEQKDALTGESPKPNVIAPLDESSATIQDNQALLELNKSVKNIEALLEKLLAAK